MQKQNKDEGLLLTTHGADLLSDIPEDAYLLDQMMQYLLY